MNQGASSDLEMSCREAPLSKPSELRPTPDLLRNRMPESDFVRGLAIFGVLILHSSFTSRFSDRTMAVQVVLARLFDWAVLAFFFSSGLLYNRFAPFIITLKKRFMSLLVPFFLYNVVYNLCFASIEVMKWGQSGESKLNFLRLVSGVLQSPAFQLYFLPYLFIISVGICGLDKLNQRYYEWGYRAILVSALGFYIWHGYPQVSHGAAFDKLPLYVIAFLIGVVGKPTLELRFTNLGMITVALGISLYSLTFSRSPVASLAVPPLLFSLARLIPKMANSKLLLSMGMMSGSIYVWHTPLILPAFSRLLAYFGLPSLFVLLGSLSLTLATCMFARLGLDWLFPRILRMPTPRIITL